MKAMIIVCALMLASAGCKPADPAASGKESGGSTLVDAVTQKNKLEAGKKAAAQIREISAGQQQDMKDALGE